MVERFFWATTANRQFFYVGIVQNCVEKSYCRSFTKKNRSTMVRPRTLRLGKGARCNVLVKNLRPSREITKRILNPLPRQRVTDLIVTRRAIITHGRSSYEAIYSRVRSG